MNGGGVVILKELHKRVDCTAACVDLEGLRITEEDGNLGNDTGVRALATSWDVADSSLRGVANSCNNAAAQNT